MVSAQDTTGFNDSVVTADGGPVVMPPALYLPSTGRSVTFGAEIELRRTKDGRLSLLAYTALDRLARCMGPHQPWVLYETARLDELKTVQHYDVIYLDMEMPRELWRTAGDGES